MPKSPWIDITLPLNTEIPLPPAIPRRPGEPPPQESKIPNPRVYRFFDVDKGDKVTMSRIEMSSHDGTHLKTKNSPVVWSKRQYDGKFVTVSLEAAKYLAAKKIRLIGFDYISLA